MSHSTPGWFGRLGIVLLAVLVLLPARVRAEDEAAEPAAPAGPPLAEICLSSKRLEAKGDAKSLREALAALDARKTEADESIEFWKLYARLWLALKKDANELWNVVVVERQQAAPKSVAFDLARAHVETDAKAKGKAIDAALKRNPKSVPARVEKAKWYIADELDDEGAELIEEVLEEDEHCLAALLVIAQLDLSDGMPEDAIEYLDKALEKHQVAEVHHLKALCYKRLALNQYDAWKKALGSATEAMGLEPTEDRIELFNELLKKTGDTVTAAKALRTHYEKTKHPLLGAMLAESAFKAGDYEGAVLGLGAGDGTDLVTLKGLATAHARLGQVAEAQAAAEKLMTVDAHGTLFAARLDLFLGDAAAATKRLGSLADTESRYLRALAHAWRGEADAVLALAKKEGAKGTRAGEALLIAWLQARVLAKMDADLANAVRKKLLEARFAAGREVVAQAQPHQVNLGKSMTAGWPRRALTWFRSRCGTFYRAVGEGFGSHWTLGEGKENTISSSVSGEADCGDDKATASFTFNGRKSKTIDGWIRLMEEDEIELKDFAPAEEAFTKGCKALVAGKPKEAEAAFGAALTIEPNWSRLKVLRSVIRALEDGDEKRADAREAKATVEPWTDDFELRRLVIFLRAWVGDADLAEEIKALAEREAQYNVRNLSAL